MNFHKLTHNDAGARTLRRARPTTARVGTRWVSATKTRGHRLGNTLGDWLHRHGETHGFERDPPPDERLDLRRSNMKQGIAFEDRVAGYLAQRAELFRITADGLESRDPEKARATVAALEAGCAIVHGGVLWNPETRTYGIPDFLIRSDVFARLFPDHPDPYEGIPDSRGRSRITRRLALRGRGRQVHDAPSVRRTRPGTEAAQGVQTRGDQQRWIVSRLPSPTLPLQRRPRSPSGVRAAPRVPAGPWVETEVATEAPTPWSGSDPVSMTAELAAIHPGGG